jgi:hypothetical protein
MFLFFIVKEDSDAYCKLQLLVSNEVKGMDSNMANG